MTFADRLSVWFFLGLALFAWLGPWVHRRLERRRGIAPPARPWKPAPASAEWKMSLDPKRGIEETRLMPGANQGDPGDEDQVAEGVGMVRPPRRIHPSSVTPNGVLDPSTKRALEELAREAHRGWGQVDL